jgi:hypothetical protein
MMGLREEGIWAKLGLRCGLVEAERIRQHSGVYGHIRITREVIL